MLVSVGYDPLQNPAGLNPPGIPPDLREEPAIRTRGMFPFAHRSFFPTVPSERGKYFCRTCLNMHVFSEGNIKQFDMVLLFSFGTLDLPVLLFFFFFWSFPLFLFPHELIQERAREVLQEKEAQCVPE